MSVEKDLMFFERWQALLSKLQLSPETTVFSQLIAAYSEPHRAYHTLKHLEECFTLLDELRELAICPAEVECALWFHDAAYNPQAQDNEAQSAQWTETFLVSSGAGEDRVKRVKSYVLATRHSEGPVKGDGGLVQDIDLTILGADRVRFAEFEAGIRKEYAWVPEHLYRSKRAEVLQSFLDRARIYQTDAMFLRFENRARINLARALRSIRD